MASALPDDQGHVAPHGPSGRAGRRQGGVSDGSDRGRFTVLGLPEQVERTLLAGTQIGTRSERSYHLWRLAQDGEFPVDEIEATAEEGCGNDRSRRRSHHSFGGVEIEPSLSQRVEISRLPGDEEETATAEAQPVAEAGTVSGFEASWPGDIEGV